MRRMLVTLAALATMTAAGNAQGPQTTQSSPDPQAQIQFLQHAVAALQAQRNKAEDEVAQTTAQAQSIQGELVKAQGEIKTLQAELEKAKPAKPIAPVPEKK